MKKMWKSFLAALLCVCLLVSGLPLSALAAVIDNTPEENQEILAALEELCGSAEEAQSYYALLEQYGLLEENGAVAESWEITLDGENITLDQLREILAGNYDPEQLVLVDGTPISLEDLDTVLQIEDYIAYLQETYFSGQKWTKEQLLALKDLNEQIKAEGIQILAAAEDIPWPSGVSHVARVSVTQGERSGNTATFTASLSGAVAEQEVSFQWRAQSGSQPVAATGNSGAVTLTADDSGAATATFTVTLQDVSTEGDDPVRSSAGLRYFIQLDNIQNALFDKDGAGVDAMTLQCDVDGNTTMPENPAFTLSGTLTVTTEPGGSFGPTYTQNPVSITFTEDHQKAVQWSIVDEIRIDQTTYTADQLAEDSSTMIWVISQGVSLLVGTRFVEVKLLTENNVSVVSASWGYRNSDEYEENTTNQVRNENLQEIDFGSTITLTGRNAVTKFIVDEEGWYTTDVGSVQELDVTASFNDTKAPSVVGFSAPSGDYYPGQMVPVTVTFSEPVNAGTAQVKFNGEDKKYTPAEGSGYSNKLTFLYTVQETDNSNLSLSSVTATDLNSHTLSEYNPGGDTQAGAEVTGVVLKTPVNTHAFESFSAEIKNAITAPELVVTAEISSDESMTQWLGDEFENQNDVWTSMTLGVKVSGVEGVTRFTAPSETITGATITAQIPLPLNTTGEDVDYTAELVITAGSSDNPVIGKYAAAVLSPAVFVEEEDLSVSLSVKNSDGTADYEYEDDEKIIYAQDNPQIQASFTLNSGKTYSYGDESKVTTYKIENGQYTTELVNPDADFVWTSSNLAVANIDETGKITPTGTAGTASFTLTALNGNAEGKQVEVTTDTLAFGVGLTPFISMSGDTISTVAGKDLIIVWTSNLCDKNGEETETEFLISLTQEGTEDSVWTTSVTGTAATPASRATIPGEFLTYDYDANGINAYTVTVSSTYLGQEYEATATIQLQSQPAVVAFDKLPSYYITDTQGPVSISWKIENFDQFSGDNEDGDLFKLEILKNDEETPLTVTAPPGTQTEENGTYTGSYTLSNLGVIADSSNPTSYRDVYTVTIQAKNGADSTWSYDSFLLYVYDADALQIMVDETTAGDSLTMSNRSEFSNGETAVNTAEWQEWVISLKRDIYLKNVISANYGAYAWTELADQISWASSDSSVASINYQQGTLYENIEKFAYTSYRPTTDFILSGLSDGNTTVTATHKLTGMTDALNVSVETMKDRLYLFQCYPQATTILTFEVYTDASHSTTEEVTVTSDQKGAAAYYAEFGIASDVHCQTTSGGDLYVGTFYKDQLKTGEGDSTQMELYPCNNLQLRRAAYAYLYLKKPDGTPYTGNITFRGGVYVNGEYKEDAKFSLNGNSTNENQPGNQDSLVTLGNDGRLEVIMDQTQWDLEGNAVSAGDEISYVFQIEQGNGGTDYYPLLVTIDASANEDAFVGSGEAIVNFRENPTKEKHPFIAAQIGDYYTSSSAVSLLEYTGNVGPGDSTPRARITTAVMWWGDETASAEASRVALVTEDLISVADGSGEFTLENTAYPFSDVLYTQYTIYLDSQSIAGIVEQGKTTGLLMNYYADGSRQSRQESLPFRLCNMLGMGKVEDQDVLSDLLTNMGGFVGTEASTDSLGIGDQFVSMLLRLVSSDQYTTGDDKLFSIQLAATSDPTKFLGFIEVNIGNMSDQDQVTGVYATGSQEDLDYAPGLAEVMMLTGAKTPTEYVKGQLEDLKKAAQSKGVRNISFDLGGYAESLIYYNADNGKWEIQILNGGFNAGGGLSYSWNFNTWCGPIPFTTTLTAGGVAEVSMDALTVAYRNSTTQETGLGNDFLTELRIYLYLRFFAGVGFDYSIIAFKLGVFGQVNLDMQFQWLNRPYITGEEIYNAADGRNKSVMNGQSFKIDGQIGLEFLMKVLFISFEKVLFSYNFNLLNEQTGQWESIQASWQANQSAQKDAIAALMENGSVSLMNVGGQQMLSLNLAPTLEDRDYLENPTEPRRWGSGGIQLFSLDQTSGLASLETNSYPYSNPVVSDDGSIVAYVTDQDSTDAEKTHVAYSTRENSGAYGKGQIIPDGETEVGYGDSQLALSGTRSFAVAAWTRQTESIQKDSGAALTDDDQMVMLNSTDVYASIYNGSTWTTTRLTTNGTPDLAPVVATNGSKAIVAWRAVSSSGPSVTADGVTQVNPTKFDQKDTIVYKIYDGSNWREEQTLYNGTSGSVKAIVAGMLGDGTAAVAYTLDKDSDDDTTYDREIVYSVIDKNTGAVTRNVEATNDSYLDENPQLAAVTFPTDDQERFVLGWYTQQAVAQDDAQALDGGSDSASSETVPDIRLLDFDAKGAAGQLLPDSISQVADAADVSITSNFRFTKNAKSINDLSILWVERSQADAESLDGGEPAKQDESTVTAEYDVLKGVKFYTYGEQDELVRFTGAVDVADMSASPAGEGTVIDWFDAYVNGSSSNEVKAVILGTTYGEDGETVTKTAQAIGGETVSFTVPSKTSCMYTATETYSDKVEVLAVAADYETVRLNSTTQIYFTVKNNGIHVINQIGISLDGQETTFDELNLLPGSTIQLAANYSIGDQVTDPAYSVTAAFSGTAASAQSAEGTVYLNLPDVEITSAEIVSEEEGKRTIQVKLNNHADAVLENSSTKVKLGFYTDATYETPISAQYFENGSGDEGYTVLITEAGDLTMINEGGYATQVTFDVGAFVGAGNEIPETGVQVYIKAEVLDSEDKVQGEPIASDNYAEVTCENLEVRTGKEVSIANTLSVEDGSTTVAVELQNNRLTETATGNLIVTLLDATGNVLAQQQSYRPGAGSGENNGLITLGGEAKALTQTFVFQNMEGASVRVTYSDVILDDNNANLAKVAVDGVSLTYDADTRTYSGTGTDLQSALMTLVPENPGASITVNGQLYEEAIKQSFARGTNTFEIVVMAPDGTTTITYVNIINNVTAPGGGGSGGAVTRPTYPPIIPDTPHGSVSVSPRNPHQDDTVTITTQADEGYKVGEVTVTRPDGQKVTVTPAGDGTYTFTQPGGKVTIDVTFILQEWPFVDVAENDWFFSAVRYVFEHDIMVGTSGTTFDPSSSVTRSQVVQMLYNLESQPAVSGEDGFTDVQPTDWWYNAVVWAAQNEVVSGYGDGTFLPKQNISRQEFAQMLFNYAKFKEYDLTATGDLSKFPDGEDVEAWAKTAMQWANGNELINGHDNGTLEPKGTTTRGQAASILMKFDQTFTDK